MAVQAPGIFESYRSQTRVVRGHQESVAGLPWQSVGISLGDDIVAVVEVAIQIASCPPFFTIGSIGGITQLPWLSLFLKVVGSHAELARSLCD